jgi:anti-sigma factor ChrR (cupin superfamily)
MADSGKWKKNKDEVMEKTEIDDGNLHVNVIRLEPGKKIPFHTHKSTKYNYVLKGSMSDEKGSYVGGDVVENKKGTSHSVTAGEDGCEFLVIWCG